MVEVPGQAAVAVNAANPAGGLILMYFLEF